MPSLRALGLGLTSLLQIVTANPLGSRAIAAPDCKPSPITKYPEPTPTLPLTGGATELPSTNLTLQYLAIGHGIQNYTCATTASTPVQLGAIATLYDATILAYTNENLLHAIPPMIVDFPQPVSATAPLSIFGQTLQVLGHHFFDIAGTPVFDLTTVKKIGFMAKTLGVAAPATANVGPLKTGAVAWLDLNKKPGYTSVGISQVYRVVTAGGNALPNCTSGAGVQSIPYAAEYWFFN